MENLVSLGIRSIFIDNMIFAYFLGMCSYLAVSKTVKTSMGLGLAVIFVLTLTVPINYLVYTYFLKEGALTWVSADFASLDLTFIQLMVFIAVIASFVQLTEMAVEKISPALYSSLGIFLPLIAVNCSILGGALFMVQKNFSTLAEATVYGFSSGIGWLLAVVLFAAIRERLKYSNVPKPLKGLGLAFIIVGLMSFAFQTFLGIAL